MRLLRTTDLTFGEFFNQTIPSYCILSHRWGDDEATYQRIISGTVNKNSSGYQKVVKTCALARSLGWSWIWIDSACIDKTASSELSEAINSMMKWYAAADFCIAYLADVPSVQNPSRNPREAVAFGPESFRQSSWFTRGWTLQELIAPRHVYFYNASFQFIGSKADLSHEISDITGIEDVYLLGRKAFTEACVATRMSWSSRRVCTREEDEAYCLLGIMQVNMPLLYGEGKMAFMRLQLQIIAQSNDETIFAWLPPGPVNTDEPFGMLAESPTFFAQSKHLRCTNKDAARRLPYSYSNRGLEFQQYTGLLTGSTNPNYDSGGDNPTRLPGGTFLKPDAETRLALRCKRRVVDRHGNAHYERVAIELCQLGNSWYRVHCDRWLHTKQSLMFSGLIQSYYIAQPNIVTHSDGDRARLRREMENLRVRQEMEDLEREREIARNSKLFRKGVVVAATAVLAVGVVRAYRKRRDSLD